MRIVFYGANAASFSPGFAEMVGGGAEVALLPDILTTEAERARFVAADVIIATHFDASLPQPKNLRLFHAPAAGTDAIDLAALPASAMVCNCFGHETAIAEYVMAALLQRQIPIAAADAELRQGKWTYWAGAPERVHGELAGSVVGLLGFGHIAQAIALRAHAFGMKVIVANRSPVAVSEMVSRYVPLSALGDFWGSADHIIVTLPLTAETKGIVDAAAFGAMRSDAVLVNVARGPVVDEQALFDALSTSSIGGAVIDTWYQYPKDGAERMAPASLPFDTLPNVVMTPHMSGWTQGTITRRQQTMADNIRARMRGEACVNVVKSA